MFIYLALLFPVAMLFALLAMERLERRHALGPDWEATRSEGVDALVESDNRPAGDHQPVTDQLAAERHWLRRRRRRMAAG